MSEVPLQNHGAMFDFSLTPDDRAWLSKEHPTLYFRETADSVLFSGTLKFEMVYEVDKDRFMVFPKDYKGSGVLINDEYEIKIALPKSGSNELPKVYETASRITEVAKHKSLLKYDLHFNFDDSACLYVAGTEKEYFPEGFDFKTFINHLVIPFFYAQTHFQKFGKWPWGEYSHGMLGMFEWYNEQQNHSQSDASQMLDRLEQSGEWGSISQKFKGKNWVKGHARCMCGSGNKIRKCHNTALMGMWKLSKDIKRYNLTLNI